MKEHQNISKAKELNTAKNDIFTLPHISNDKGSPLKLPPKALSLSSPPHSALVNGLPHSA
ncbi:hypothetical protein [Bartonella sp. AU18XJBT]|uniref:hypothetical protein n=1 Tax=Bartonella sp. AU18XJBT TaxID=3019089 RepID=UPI0023606BC6|nr:hypothetical protein [Bartonella sp. AU18XJBT]